MSYTSNAHKQLVRQYCKVRANQLNTGMSLGNKTSLTYKGDLTFSSSELDWGSGVNASYIGHWIPVSSLLGMDMSSIYFEFGQISDPFKVHKPEKLTYRGDLDTRAYGFSILDALAIFRGGEESPPPFENGVHHFLYEGELSDSDHRTEFFTRTSNAYNLRFNTQVDSLTGSARYSRATQIGLNANGYRRFSYDGLSTGLGAPNFSFIEFFRARLEKLKLGDLTWTTAGQQYSSHFVRENCTFEESYQHLFVVYDLSWSYVSSQSDIRCKFRVTIDTDLWSDSVSGDTILGLGPAVIKPGLFVRNHGSVELLEFSNTKNTGFTPPTVSTPWAVEVLSEAQAGGAMACLFSSLGGEVNSPVVTNFDNWRFRGNAYVEDHVWSSLDLYMRNNMRELRRSSFFSSGEGVENLLGGLQANHLENLTQVSGLLSLIPDVGPLMYGLAKLMKGDPRGLKQVVDCLTDNALRFNWGIAPTVGDVTELVKYRGPKDLTTRQRWTAQGVFNWYYPEEQNPMGSGVLKLQTHSKVVMSYDASTVLNAFLAGYNSGLLPNLSNLWGATPGSFFVDWFTGNDARAKAADHQTLLMAMDVHYCVHSYKLEWYPDSSELDGYHLSGDSFHATRYIREKTRYMPKLRDGELDFLAPTMPNLVSVGSFVYQTLT